MSPSQTAQPGSTEQPTVPPPTAESIAKTRELDALCVDVIDLGTVNTPWGLKPKLKLVFETAELKPNGYRRSASRTYNVNYYEKGMLRRDLESWRGKPLTPGELLTGVDFSKLVGKPCLLEVTDATTTIEGRPFLQIEAIRKAGKNGLAPSGTYRRWQESPNASAQPPQIITPRVAEMASWVQDIRNHLSRDPTDPQVLENLLKLEQALAAGSPEIIKPPTAVLSTADTSTCPQSLDEAGEPNETTPV